MKLIANVAFLLFSACVVVVAEEKAPAGPELEKQVRGIFQAKCVECHGASLPKPRGKFGYVLDLDKIAANPKMVQPGNPEKSELYQLVRDNKMPTRKASSPPLTAAEKEIVKEWIKSGTSTNAVAAKPTP